MTTPQDPQQYIHRVAADPDGNRIGKVSQVYSDDSTGQQRWLLVETGLFGARHSFAPIHGARVDGEVVCDTRSHAVSELVEEVWLMPGT